MNSNTNSEIRIVKPFEDGYVIMKALLFQPFDLSKWLVIGFAAFIAGRVTGGGGFSPPLNLYRHSWAGSHADVSGDAFEHSGLFIGLFIASMIFIFILAVVFMWIRARGIFVFTDCIARRRAAIKDPWREYRREGNSLFLFHLCVMLAIMGFIALVAVTCVAVASLLHLTHDQEIVALVSVAAVGLVAYMCALVILSLILYFMPMVMYRRRCRALEAFHAVWSLIWKDPGAFTWFALFGILLLFGSLMVASAVMCATCCIALLPYVGTVLMLPVFVWLRSFGLLFFRQFGPECDVWAGAQPIPASPPPLPPPVQAVTG